MQRTLTRTGIRGAMETALLPLGRVRTPVGRGARVSEFMRSLMTPRTQAELLQGPGDRVGHSCWRRSFSAELSMTLGPQGRRIL